MAAELRTHNDYTVGWVCALPKEQTAATAMLDQTHGRLPKAPNDPNSYILGSIGDHNIVIACLPKGKTGANSAATVASHMVNTFPVIRFGLIVGIGGGIPPKVRLGDVVVSVPTDQYPGVVQWDLGKAEQGGRWRRTGALNNPPTLLLTALTALETEHELTGPKIPEYLEDIRERWPRLAARYLKSDSLEDVLFKARYEHVSRDELSILSHDDGDEEEGEEEEDSCHYCDKSQVVKRRPREMRVHYGLIASGNAVIKNATFRDDLNRELGGKVLCVEMEAAGLADNFPCLVIRGICDYADSHKNDMWQEHAAAVAAAFAKEVLEYVQPVDVNSEKTVKDQLSKSESLSLTDFHGIILILFDIVSNTVSSLKEHVTHTRSLLDKKEDLEVLSWLTPTDYAARQSDFIRLRQSGTGQWLIDSPEYQQWIGTKGEVLFCPGIPGAGKTVLVSIVVDHLFHKFQADDSVGISYLYCNFRRGDEQQLGDMLLSLVKQLSQSQHSLPQSVRVLYDRHTKTCTRPTQEEVCNTLLSVAANFSRVFVVVDALDECQASKGYRSRFISELLNLRSRIGANVLATSRFIPEISERFCEGVTKEIRATRDDISRYLGCNVAQLPGFVSRNLILQTEITESIMKCVDGM